MRVKLYVVPASHPSAATEAALVLKGIPYERVDLLPVLHKPIQRARFGTGTVPGLAIDSERVVGSRNIAARLDELAPDPPLYPADAEARARVQEADAWGDEVLQPAVRRLTWATLRRRPKAMRSFAEGARLPVPLGLAMTSAGLVARAEIRIHGASEEVTRADLRDLPGQLDHGDALIEAGVIGGEQPNAADLQIFSSVALLLALGDLRPLVEGRPAAAHARRLFPAFPGDAPAGILPAEWIPR